MSGKIVPRVDGEGALGRSDKQWGDVQTKKINNQTPAEFVAAQTPKEHALDAHTPVTLEELNAIISDATIPNIPEVGINLKSKLLAVNAAEDGVEWIDPLKTLPEIKGNDAGKLLTVNDSENGVEWKASLEELPIIGESDGGRLLAVKGDKSGVEWVDETRELPSIAGNDAGKHLAVNATENGVEWVSEAKELPTITGGDKRRPLVVNSAGNGVEWGNFPTELPSTDSGDKGKVLTVNATENGVEWKAVPEELPVIGESDGGRLLAVRGDKSGVEWILETEELPAIGENDGGKLLAAKADKSGVEWVSKAGELPEIAEGSAGKMLTVNSTEDGIEWKSVPKELPSITSFDGGKLLAAKADKSGVEWVNETKELPSIKENDKFKVLTVNGAEDGAEWEDAPKELPAMVGNDAGKVLTVNLTGDDAEWAALPDATSAAKGVVKIGSGLSVSSGTVSVDEAATDKRGIAQLATVAETTAGTAADKVITPSALNASPAMRISDVVYNGEDLTVKFASEIAGFDNVWAWIKSRITAGSYDGIHIADYIPFTITGGEQFQAQVAGIDTYLNCGDEGYEQDRHIDFISRDCKSNTEQWNTTNNNNGNATNAAPWMVSNIRTKLNTLVSSLPAGLQSVVATKRTLLETRYTSGSTLTSSTSWEWNDMGKLWLPSEYEVNGSLIWSGVRAIGLGTQYPIFANNRRFAIKGAGHNGSRAYWWLSAVSDGHSAGVCSVTSGGYPNSTSASNSRRVPLCFRIS